MGLISRSEIGFELPDYRRALSTTHNGWFWHWLGGAYPEKMTDIEILLAVQRYHMDTKGWSDIAYSFAVGREVHEDGTAKTYELRGWDVAGGHTQGYNNTSMAIVFLIGEGEKPTPAMFRAAYELMAQRPEMSGPRSHRDVGSTQCPGDDIASEVTNPQHKDTLPMIVMTPSAAEIHVNEAYKGYLGREADAGGFKFWTNALIEGDWTVADMRSQFLVTRLAADDARTKALAAKVDSPRGVSTEKVAEQVYRLFLDDLAAIGAK